MRQLLGLACSSDTGFLRKTGWKGEEKKCKEVAGMYPALDGELAESSGSEDITVSPLFLGVCYQPLD